MAVTCSPSIHLLYICVLVVDPSESGHHQMCIMHPDMAIVSTPVLPMVKTLHFRPTWRAHTTGQDSNVGEISCHGCMAGFKPSRLFKLRLGIVEWTP
ncbi:hypothetical protein K439DRAFT_1638644 [Ramaria rubella]|nr:hypothetical protein K439DRAFT_1638644 [Ramaria rubella]